MNSKSPIIVFNIYSIFHLPVHESWVLPVIFNIVFLPLFFHESWLFHVIFNSVFYFLLCVKVVSSQSYWILYFTSLSVRAVFSLLYLILWLFSAAVLLPGSDFLFLLNVRLLWLSCFPTTETINCHYLCILYILGTPRTKYP